MSVSGSTSSSLLRRAVEHDPEAWRRLARLYGPLVYRWTRQAGLQDTDAADVGQEVFRTVAARIGDFRRDQPGASFRGWMWGITRIKLKEFLRLRAAQPLARGGSDAQELLAAAPDLPPEELSSVSAAETRCSLVHRATAAVRVEFEEKTWQAFWRSAVEGRETAEIAADLAMSPKAVRQAKYRVLRRLRMELDGLL